MNRIPRTAALPLGTAAALLLSACFGGGGDGPSQPTLTARAKPLLTVDGLQFKDANGSGTLEPYEDWRLSPERRAADLVARMTIDEKAGMMLIDTLNAPVAPSTIANTNADRFINTERMTRFIFRNGVELNSTTAVSPRQAAEFTNAVQELAEKTRLGIPVIFKSNARNHYDRSARQGINEPAGSFSQWPKEPGLAAIRDMDLIADFGRTIADEWTAIGLRGSYAYMADLATEPRWFRVHEVFTEDADLAADIQTALVKNFQGGPIDRSTRVAMTIKHFPGGGPALGGFDAHYTFGKFASYPSNRFDDHLKPFRAAVKAGVSAIMPYYSVPQGLTYEGTSFAPVGFAFNGAAVNDLLRGRIGFKGYINSDTGIIEQRAWGFESKTVNERIAAAINAGTDVLSGFNRKQAIVDVVAAGLVSAQRVDQAVSSLLVEQFALGLFENPYVDATLADGIVGKQAYLDKALDAQRRSLTLLQNDGVLPLNAPTAAAPQRLYTVNLNADIVGGAAYGGYQVTAGDRTTANGNTRAAVPAGTQYALIRVEVTNNSSAYASNSPATGANPAFINPATGKTWGADDPNGIDNRLNFGGAYPWEVNFLDFTRMSTAASWRVSPSLGDIQQTMAEARAVGAKVVLSIYFRQPYVLDGASGLRAANAIVANYGVSDTALMDVLTGKARPQGKLPWALANKPSAVETQAPDAPGYAAEDTLFPFGHGLSY